MGGWGGIVSEVRLKPRAHVCGRRTGGALKRRARRRAKAMTPRNAAQEAMLFRLCEILHFGHIFRRKGGEANTYEGLALSKGFAHLTIASPNSRPPMDSQSLRPLALLPSPERCSSRVTGCPAPAHSKARKLSRYAPQGAPDSPAAP